MTPSTLNLLLRAVLDDPASDDRRLVLADALEEAGDALRAEFIRVQVELAGLDRHRCKKHPGGLDLNAWRCPLCERLMTLRGRERELLDGAVPGMPHAGWLDFAGEEATDPIPYGEPYTDYLTFRRGLVAEVRCRCVAWLDHGPRICARHPVERLELVDATDWIVEPLGVAGRRYEVGPPRSLEEAGLREQWDRAPVTIDGKAREAYAANALAWTREEARPRVPADCPDCGGTGIKEETRDLDPFGIWGGFQTVTRHPCLRCSHPCLRCSASGTILVPAG